MKKKVTKIVIGKAIRKVVKTKKVKMMKMR